jgi:FkbM family methyltransferase
LLRTVQRWLRGRLGPVRYGRLKQRLDRWLFRYRRRSYAQAGEDLFLAAYFGEQREGVYVDVGAFHPRQLSNTQLLHERGWRGLNVDPTPGAMALFRALRPRDVNLELAISDEPGTLKLHSWGLHAENSAAPRQVRAVTRVLGPAHEIVEVEARTLTEVLDASPFRDAAIDLLDVDAEGGDLAVLRSLDWARYRPRVVLVEIYARTLEEVQGSRTARFLAERGYRPVAWLRPSVVFAHEDSRGAPDRLDEMIASAG